MGVRCPKCGNTDPATIWEDNFWSGCDKCGWAASCENAIWYVPHTTSRPAQADPWPPASDYDDYDN